MNQFRPSNFLHSVSFAWVNILTKFLFLAMFLVSHEAFGKCNMSSEYAYSGTEANQNIYGRTYPDGINPSEVDTCVFLDYSCSYTVSTKETNSGGTIDLGDEITGCSVTNSKTGGSYSCAMPPYNIGGTNTTSYPASIVESEFSKWLSKGNASNWGSGTNAKVVKTVKTKRCDAHPGFLLQNTLAANNFEPQNQCKVTNDLPAMSLGSIIDTRDRSLGQSIPIAGTDLDLTYTTDNTIGSNSYNRNIQVLVSGYQPYPAGGTIWVLADVTVKVSVAGVTFTRKFLPSEIDPHNGASYTAPWNGKDSTGKVVVGAIVATSITTYNFSKGWTAATQSLYKTESIPLGSINATDKFKFGGWSLSNYHFYDSALKTVFLGNGYRLKTPYNTLSATNEYQIPSADGSLIFRFSANGRHISTRDSITGIIYTTFTHDENWNLISFSDRDGLVTQIQRNAASQLSAIVNPYGVTTKVRMDVAGNLYEIEDPIGRINRFTYKGGLLNAPMASMRDPGGKTKTYEYDSENKLLRAVNAKGGIKTLAPTQLKISGGIESTVKLTSPMGRVSNFQSVSNNDGSSLLTNVDPSGFTVTQATTSDGLQTVVTDSTESIRQTIMKTNPRFRNFKSIASVSESGPGGYYEEYEDEFTYPIASDPFNVSSVKLTTLANGAPYVTTYTNSNRTSTSTTAMGYRTVNTFNNRGRLAKSQFANLHPIEYAYNANGQLTNILNGSRAYSISYNAVGLPSKILDPMNNATLFTYDGAGQLLKKTLPNGRIITFGYTANGAVNSINNSNNDRYTYTFDNNDNIITNIEPIIGTNSFQWDWTYNNEDQLISTKHPDASQLTQVFNSDGTLASLTSPNLSRKFTWVDGILKSISSTGNVNLSIAGTPLPTNVSWQGAVTGSLDYTRGPFDRLDALTLNALSSINFGYNADDELIQAADLTYTRDSATEVPPVS